MTIWGEKLGILVDLEIRLQDGNKKSLNLDQHSQRNQGAKSR